ncbi:unnamed protein product [Meloidogyne enterolobii]|uniref:Uncharacterized protein n=1 Tax=Meloidogyne enterolobii TaxID=390850 RepID=A0ACB0ZZU8_MELEN
MFNKSKYKKEYYQKNKEKLNEYKRNYKKINREKISQQSKIYREKNNERIQKNKKIYYQNNKEKLNEYQRKYRQEKKNVKSADDDRTKFVNPQPVDFTNLVNLSIVCEMEGNLFNQEEEKLNNDKEKYDQIEVEEPNKIIEDDTNNKELKKKIYSFDLNKMPEDEELEDH